MTTSEMPAAESGCCSTLVQNGGRVMSKKKKKNSMDKTGEKEAETSDGSRQWDSSRLWG